MSGRHNARTDLIRLNVNLNKQSAKDLKYLKDTSGMSLTETIRRALALYYYVRKEVRSGRTLVTMKPNGKKERIIKLF